MNTSGIDLILKSIDLSFDRRKLTLALTGIVIVALVYGLFLWIALQFASDSSALAVVFIIIGLLVIWAIMGLFAGAITRLSYGDLAGWPAQGIRGALLDAFQRLPTLLFAPLLLWLAAGGVIVAEALILLLGRIPYVGELLVAIAFLPGVVLNLLLFIILFTGLWLVYPVAMGENLGVLGTLQRVIDVTRRAPGRILVYAGLTLFLSLLVTLALIVLVSAAYSLTSQLAIIGMSASRVMYVIDPIGRFAEQEESIFAEIGSALGGIFRPPSAPATPSVTMGIALTLMLLETVILWLGSLWAVPWVFNLTASCAVYQTVAGAAPAPQPQPVFVPQLPPWQPTPAPQPYIPTQPPQAPYAQPAYPQPAASPPAPPVQPPWPPTQQVGPTPPITPPPVTPPVLRVCHACGKPLAKPDSRFCPSCGARQV